jgi:TetR/AcrR family transcriptional regulator
VQILEALAAMLEQPGAERITTAALAARLEVSEAALYRHFASKAQMFEGLIEFIEQTVFTLINQITERERPCRRRRQAAAKWSWPCCCSLAKRTPA